MYLSNIDSKEDKLRKVQVCKKGNLQKCKSTSYLQSTLSPSQNQAITMTDLQWLSSKVNTLWVIYLKSLQGLFVTSWDMEETSLAKSLADEQGRMLMARVWGFHAFTLSWGSQEIAWTTTCEDYKQLGPAVYHSTGSLQSHNSHKRFLKMPCDIRCPFPRIVSNWQSHNSHKRVLKMPLVVVAVVSIS